MRYVEAYRWGEEELSRAGITESKLDARLLLEHVCGTDRNMLLVHGDREVSEVDFQCYKEMIGRRRSRIPLQHITGVQEFMGLEFLVNEHVLIPRQDTECLVEEVMRFLQDDSRILDMCTGSGCILLSLLHYSNNCKGVGVDISEEALKVARANGERIMALPRPGVEPIAGDEGALRFIQSDLFSGVKEEKFEIIVSNPPYIASGVIPALMEEVKDHEPILALDGKEDGLFFYRKIVEAGRAHLVKEGRLFLEIGYDQAEAVSGLMEAAGFEEVTVVKDLAGLDRVVHGIYMEG